MIAKLRGTLDTIGLDWVILDVQGVGYNLFCSNRTLSRLPEQGAVVSFFTEMLIRNELPVLFGFLDTSEQICFQKLITVQGVGPKVALAILSVMGPDELALAICNQDKPRISRAEGVGPKLAARLITELKDKMMTFGGEGSLLRATSSSGEGERSSLEDVFSALENLGYKRSEVASSIAQAVDQQGATAAVPVLIKATLSLLSSRLMGGV
jgi:Holliday junction DNA helicase RuvA